MNDDVFLFRFFFNMSMFALYVHFTVNFLIRLPCILMRGLTGVSSSYHRCEIGIWSAMGFRKGK